MVDADDAHVGLLTDLLESNGHRVVAAHDGVEGLRLFREELPDLVILDLLLPRLDGSSLCAQIKASEHGAVTPVVVATAAYKNQSKVAFMRESGAVDFVSKPVTADKLTTLIDWIFAPERDDTTIDDPVLDALEVGDAGSERTDLAAGSLPRLLIEAQAREFSGLMVATRGDVRKGLQFEQGCITAARSNLPADRIDRVLLSMRLLSANQIAQLEAWAGCEPEPFLRELEEHGLFDDTQSRAVVQRRAMSIGMSLFRWDEGQVRCFPDAEPRGTRLEQPIQPLHLTAIGMRRSPWLLDRIAADFPSEAILVQGARAQSRSTDLLLDRRERNVLGLIDGKRTVRDIRELGEMVQQPTDPALALLVGVGILELGSEIAPTPSDPAKSGETDATQLQGSLARRPLVELFGTLSRDAVDGTLVIEGEHRTSFTFRAGRLVHARSTKLEHRLGQILREQGAASASAIENALELQREEGGRRRLGTLLVDQGELTLDRLSVAFREQLLLITRAACSWIEGTYSFSVGDRDRFSVSTGLSTDELLRLGAAQLPRPWLMQRWCGGDERAYVSVVGRERDGLRRSEEHLLDDIGDTDLMVEELLRFAPEPDEVLIRLQFLIASGHLEVTHREPPEPKLEGIAGELDAGAMPYGLPQRDAGAATTQVDLAFMDGAAEDLIVEVEAMDPPAAAVPAAAALAPVELPPSELAPEPAVGPDANLTALLAFVKAEMLEDKRRAEALVRELSEEIGRLRERIRMLEEGEADPPSSATKKVTARKKTTTRKKTTKAATRKKTAKASKAGKRTATAKKTAEVDDGAVVEPEPVEIG